MPPAGGPPFRVLASQAVWRELRNLQHRADREGWGAEFLSTLTSIQRRLIEDPNEFGEPLYRLSALRMQIRHAVVRPLSIDFAVCEDRPIVFIKIVSLLSRISPPNN